MVRRRQRAHARLAKAAAHIRPAAAVAIVPSEARVAKQSTVMAVLAPEAPRSAAEATARALAIPNRGPLALDADGNVPQAVTDAFEEYGFYVFVGALGSEELAELQEDMHAVIDGATNARASGAETFDHGGVAIEAAKFGFSTPLSDNSGPEGRSPSPMQAYEPPPGAPDQVCKGASYYCAFSEPGVRLYGHPLLLAVAEAVNGAGFTPFSDSLQVKIAQLGPAVAWRASLAGPLSHSGSPAGSTGELSSPVE